MFRTALLLIAAAARPCSAVGVRTASRSGIVLQRTLDLLTPSSSRAIGCRVGVVPTGHRLQLQPDSLGGGVRLAAARAAVAGLPASGGVQAALAGGLRGGRAHSAGHGGARQGRRHRREIQSPMTPPRVVSRSWARAGATCRAQGDRQPETHADIVPWLAQSG